MRARRAAAVVAGAMLAVGVAVAVVPAVAPWTASASASAPLNAAKVGTSMTLTSGAGSVTGSSYQLGGLLFTQYGYLDIANTSTIPVGYVVSVELAALLAGTTVTACTTAWVTTGGGSCTGTQTVIADGAVLLGPTANYAIAVSPPGGHVYLRCRVAGVLAGITVTMTAPVTRAAGDRTAS